MTKQTGSDVLYAVTAAVSANAFLRGQLRAMSEVGRVGLVVGDEVPEELVRSEGVEGFTIGLSRQPSLAADVLALGRLVRLIRRQRPRAVVFGTPKMGLLAAVATFLCRTPRRIYVLHGYRWEGLHGWRRFLLTSLEALACRLATDVVAVGPSVKETAIKKLRVAADRVHILSHGSANGIDCSRFVPIRGEDRIAVRSQLGLPAHGLLFTFAGRLTRDKGIQDLPTVWRRVATELPGAHLVVVGHPEPSSPIDIAAIAALESMDFVLVFPATGAIERLLGVADINLSLSRREGLPTVILEAGACEVPTVAYAVTGTVDAVAPGTGALVPLDSVDEFAERAIFYGLNEGARRDAGQAARRRVQQDYCPEDLWDAWIRYLDAPPDQIKSRGREDLG